MDAITFKLVAAGTHAALYDLFLNGRYQRRITLFAGTVHTFTLR